MKITTIRVFSTTIMALNAADSWVPFTSSRLSATIINSAGRLIRPCCMVPFTMACSKGEWLKL